MNDSHIPSVALEIQRLVHEHLIEYRTAVQAAVQAAVEAAFVSPQLTVKPPAERAPRTKPTARPAKRRSSAEIAELGERFYTLVCQQPGEPMTTLAPLLGVSARELAQPIAGLKRAGRIRSVGQRSETKYFPCIGKSVAHLEVAS